MQYRWRVRTQDTGRGAMRDLDPASPHTQQLVEFGIIEAVETKVVSQPEVKAKPKAKRGRPRKVKADE